MRNPIDQTRIKQRQIGDTHGDRRKIRKEREKAQVANIPAHQRPVDKYKRGPVRPDDRFVGDNSYKAARRYVRKDMRHVANTAYKHVVPAELEDGQTEYRRNPKGRPSDQALDKYLHTVMSDPRLANSRTVRENFGKKSIVARKTPRAQQTVDGMARAQRIAKRAPQGTPRPATRTPRT